MASKKKVAAKKKASGRNITEAERNTEAVKLRLHYETSQTLEELAKRWGFSKSRAVEVALRFVQSAARGELQGSNVAAELSGFITDEGEGLGRR